PSLLLLEFLARDLAAARLLVVATYRDVEVRRGDPLARTLGDLARRPHVMRLTLGGLSVAEVARVVALARGGSGPSPEDREPDPLAERLHRDTEGNPLFVQELVRLLVAEGRLGGAGVGDEGAAPR